MRLFSKVDGTLDSNDRVPWWGWPYNLYIGWAREIENPVDWEKDPSTVEVLPTWTPETEATTPTTPEGDPDVVWTPETEKSALWTPETEADIGSWSLESEKEVNYTVEILAISSWIPTVGKTDLWDAVEGNTGDWNPVTDPTTSWS